MVVIRSAPLRDLDAVTAYEIARLRQDVFVVEQACVYPDLDGRDLEPGAVQVWAEDGVGVVACLRVLREPGGGVRIGRVATARGARGEGVATALVSTALEEAPRPGRPRRAEPPRGVVLAAGVRP